MRRVQVSPYSVVVPVADTSDAERNNAFSDALAQVLARIAGGQDLSSKPGYADVLKGASGIVQQFQYQRAATGLSLQVTFDQAAVRGPWPSWAWPAPAPSHRCCCWCAMRTAACSTRTRWPASRKRSLRAALARCWPDPAKTSDTANLAAPSPSRLAAINQQYNTGLVLLGKVHGNSG